MKQKKQSSGESTSPAEAEPQAIEYGKGGWINEFLWSCAGVNKAVLRQCPGDHAKYAGIGGTILFTAMMAAISGGYALNFVFDNEYIAIAFGVFWGLLIFNLDRFIVNTMYSDGKPSISWPELRSGLPRIIMAVFLGIVISTPLELKVFEDSIAMQIEKEKATILNNRLESRSNELNRIEEELAGVYAGANNIYATTIHTGNQVIDNLNDSINQLQGQLDREQSSINDLVYRRSKLDIDASDYATKKKAIDDQISVHRTKRNSLSQQIKRLINEKGTITAEVDQNNQDRIDAQKADIARLSSQRDTIRKEIEEARSTHPDWSSEEIRLHGSIMDRINLEYRGFNAHLKAFHDIRSENAATDIAGWFIMLLFVIIETAPTFFKMMMSRGPYDDLLYSESQRVKTLSLKRISDINDECNTSIKISTMKNQKRLEAETIANENIMKRLAEVQAELLSKSIEAWREQELKKIEENPAAYIKANTEPPSGN